MLVSEFVGDLHLEQGDPVSALRSFDLCFKRAFVLAPRGDIVAELRRRRAECFHLLGRHDEAYAEAMLGLEHTRELGDRYEEAATYRIAALAAGALGRPEESKQLFEQGFALFEDIETPYEWGKLWMAFGDWLASDQSGAYHDPRLALEAYHAAHYRFETMGAKAKLTEVNARIARSGSLQPDAIAVHDVTSEAPAPAKRSPPRPRPARSRELDRRSEWAREYFGVVTVNPVVFEILEIVEKLARSRSAVLVLGESGTGKELIAHALHRLSGRKGEFMAINCATLPRDVIESELFGHVAGAFTGASREKVGLLEVCEGGTVFLDEVSEMSFELQARLLRFLESGEIRRVGATRVAKLSTRIVAASNREEADLRSGQKFRPDLYYRLAHTVVKLPALRLRGARDIRLLAEHFLAISCEEERKTLTIAEDAHQRLASYAWPGNVRELRSTMSQRAVLTPDGGEVRAEDLRLEADASTGPGTLEEELALTERRRIEEALRMSRNSKADAARLLGIPRTTLINRMQRLGIQTE
jgi:DNA-binding NtrC family response regulator